MPPVAAVELPRAVELVVARELLLVAVPEERVLLPELVVELDERTVLLPEVEVPEERVLLPELVVLPVDRVVLVVDRLLEVEVPEERVLLPEVVVVPVLLLRLSCWEVLVERLLLELDDPLRVLLLLVEVPLERVVVVPLLPRLFCWLTLLERELEEEEELVERVEELPLVLRVWAAISVATSIVRASIKVAEKVIILLMASSVFRVIGINSNFGKPPGNSRYLWSRNQ